MVLVFSVCGKLHRQSAAVSKPKVPRRMTRSTELQLRPESTPREGAKLDFVAPFHSDRGVSHSTGRQSRNQTECARPRAQKRRMATRVEAILSLKPRSSCCGRGRPHPENSSQLANDFNDCSAADPRPPGATGCSRALSL